MPELIVFAGPNGSGKSTIRDSHPLAVDVTIDPDRITRDLRAADPRTAERDGVTAALNLFKDAIAGGKSVSIETTLSGYTALSRMREAKTADYDITLVYVGLDDAALNVSRVDARVQQGGHAIPRDTILRRATTSPDNLAAALAVADRSLVLDNSGASLRPLLEVEGKRIVSVAAELPQWLASRMDRIKTELSQTAPNAAPTHWLAASDPLLGLLRGKSSSKPPAWEPTATPFADRLREFEAKLREPQKAERKPIPQAGDEPEPPPKPTSSPKP